MKHANLAKHEMVCGKAHLMVLGKVCFCRRCGQTFASADIEQHEIQCFVEEEDLAGNLQMHNRKRIENFWRRFRNEKRRTMSMTGLADDIDSVEASDLAEEFQQWHGPRWKKTYSKNPQEAEYESESEDTKISLWPKFLQYWKKKNKDCGVLDINGSHLEVEFKQWLQRRQQRKG